MLKFFRSLFFPRFSIYESTKDWLNKNTLENHCIESCQSTNDLAKEEAFSLSTPLRLYLTDQQSEGRGRGENKWNNPEPGSSLMLSFSFQTEQPPQPISTPLVGLAVARALKNTFSFKNLSIKAPNDIYLGSKKVAGLLIESAQMGEQTRFIVGLGLNVFNSPHGLESADCLSSHTAVSKKLWQQFLRNLVSELRLASQEAMGSHLSESQRRDLLDLLNHNPNLEKKYDSVSPFGDLSQDQQVTSWRSL